MPARKIIQKHRSLTGKFFSEKNQIARLYESSLEKDLIYSLEFDSNVRNYEEQPVTIEYPDESGRKRRYTPDFLVHYKNHTPLSSSLKSTLIEVKYRKDLWKDWKVLKPRFSAAMKYADQYGWKFKILTEVEIRTEFQYNARFLVRYMKANIDTDKMDHLLNLISDFETSTPQELIIAMSVSPRMQGYYLHTLWYLIANGFICCDLTRLISMNTEIWVNEGLRQ
jgi:hypothetical protein